ncbi:MAG: hypothetical protein L7W43_17370 [Rubripirellula sp.]|nr:hypothetical protein [Rubripirellula sp.]
MSRVVVFMKRAGSRCRSYSAQSRWNRSVENVSNFHRWFVLLLCLGVSGCASIPPAATPAATPPTSAKAGDTTIVAVAAPAPSCTTLPKFLGLDVLFGGLRGVGQGVRNRLGTRFPSLESKPPVLAITDPANSAEGASPAVQAAAEAKAEEDKAPQKIKAVSYLASLGCGKCYPDTENAMLAALDDCSESVRYAAAKGLRKSVADGCGCCRQNSCCSPKLVKKLYEMGYDTEASGCYVEPSARVRRYARLAVAGCGGVPMETPREKPMEGPSTEEVLPTPAAPVSVLEDSLDAQQNSVSVFGDTPKRIALGEVDFSRQFDSIH